MKGIVINQPVATLLSIEKIKFVGLDFTMSDQKLPEQKQWVAIIAGSLKDMLFGADFARISGADFTRTISSTAYDAYLALFSDQRIPTSFTMPYSAIVAVGRVEAIHPYNVHTMPQSFWESEIDFGLGTWDYRIPPYWWEFDLVTYLPKPIPVDSSLYGMVNLPHHIDELAVLGGLNG